MRAPILCGTGFTHQSPHLYQPPAPPAAPPWPHARSLFAEQPAEAVTVGIWVGAALLLDVISRVDSLSDAVGCRGLVLHAESEQVRGL